MTNGAARRALVIAYSFPPHAAIGTMRTLRLVRKLHERGWQVTVLTGDPATYLPSTPIEHALLDRVPAAVRVIRARALRPVQRLQDVIAAQVRRPRPAAAAAAAAKGAVRTSTPADAISPRRRGALLRAKDVVDAALALPDRENGWIAPAILAGIADSIRHGRPDVIFSSAPPWSGQLVAFGLRQALRKPWVADFRDPWARAPWRGDRYQFAMTAARLLESRVVSRADRIIFVTGANQRDFATAYPGCQAKFDLVPNGCDPSEFDAVRSITPPADGPFVLLHAGSLYAGRTPLPVFNAIATALKQGLIAPQHFKLRFLGSSALSESELSAATRRLGLEEVVEFLPRVSREESLRAMMSASALLLLQPGHTISVPGKIYEYMATSRPILAIAERGEISNLLEGSGAGVVLNSESEAGIIAALMAMVRQGDSRRAPCSPEFFDGNVRAAEVATILERVVDTSRPAPLAQGAHLRS